MRNLRAALVMLENNKTYSPIARYIHSPNPTNRKMGLLQSSHLATGPSSFDRVFSDVVHVDRQFLKGFGEFLFALGHVEGDPEALVWVVGGGGENLP